MKMTSKIIATTTAVACVAAFSTVGAAAAFAQESNDDTAVITPAPGNEEVPFTASVDGKALTSITTTLNGYAHINYGVSEANPVNLYTVTIPKGTSKVDLGFGDKAVTVYNYANPDENDPHAFVGSLAGLGKSYDDFTTSFTSASVDVDLNGDSSFDYIQVQNPYNADYTGGELLYAVTFKYADDLPVIPGYKPVTKSGITYSFNGKSLTVVKVAKSKKSVTVPATVKYGKKSYKVTGIASKVFKGTKVTSVKVKSTSLTQKATKNCLKSSKVSKVTLYAGSTKTVNKIAKCFSKSNAGKKVTLIAKVAVA